MSHVLLTERSCFHPDVLAHTKSVFAEGSAGAYGNKYPGDVILHRLCAEIIEAGFVGVAGQCKAICACKLNHPGISSF